MSGKVLRRVFYVYALCRRDTNEVVYVGATHNLRQRWNCHRWSTSDTRQRAKFQAHPAAEIDWYMRALAVVGPVTVTHPNHPPMAVRWLERSWCRFYAARGPLINAPITYEDRVPAHVIEARDFRIRYEAAERGRRVLDELRKPENAELVARLMVALDRAPFDDEPLTAEEERLIAEAEEQVERGETMTTEELRRSLGLPPR